MKKNTSIFTIFSVGLIVLTASVQDAVSQPTVQIREIITNQGKSIPIRSMNDADIPIPDDQNANRMKQTGSVSNSSDITLIAHYPLTSDSNDATGNYGPMTLQNAPFQDGGIYCNGNFGLIEDTTSCHAFTPNLDGLNFDAFSISARFKVNEYCYYNPVFIGGEGYRWIGFILEYDSTVTLKYNNSNYQESDIHYSLDTWHEATVTYDLNTETGKLYLDNTLACTATFQIEHGDYRDVSIIDYSIGFVFKGIFRDLKIYNGVIDPAEQGVTIRVPLDQPTIQAGVDAAIAGDTVLVADGTYTGEGNRDIDFNGKAIVVKSVNGAEMTTIDCEGDGHRGFTFQSGEDTTSVVDGFRIINGNGFNGGAIYCRYSSPTIINNIITGNSAQNHGGGICCSDSASPMIHNNNISDNSTVVQGGGIYCWNHSSPNITNNIILGNSARWGGGINCNNESHPMIRNNLIAKNSTESNGSGILCYSDASIINSTITENTGGMAGIYCSESSTTVINSIVWNNGSRSIYQNDDSVTVTYSNIQGGWTGIGNLDLEPVFVDSASNDYRLIQGSPCIDAGDPDPVYNDADGSRNDMGSYGGPYGSSYSYPTSVLNPYGRNGIPSSFVLFQNRPNPFNPTTTIQFHLPKSTFVSLKIYDLLGREVETLINAYRPAGEYEVEWNAKKFPSGIYLCRLEAGDFVETRKLILQK